MYSYFSLDYATETIQASHDGFKLTGTHQLRVFADDVYLSGVQDMGKFIEALLAVSREVSPEGKAD
jgi:hypothetical protein